MKTQHEQQQHEPLASDEHDTEVAWADGETIQWANGEPVTWQRTRKVDADASH